jgi:hypothetical protein
LSDYIKEILEKPENRVKVYLAFNIALIVANLLVAIGAIIFVLLVLKII